MSISLTGLFRCWIGSRSSLKRAPTARRTASSGRKTEDYDKRWAVAQKMEGFGFCSDGSEAFGLDMLAEVNFSEGRRRGCGLRTGGSNLAGPTIRPNLEFTTAAIA